MFFTFWSSAFFTPWFLAAGVVAAAGPIIIHLLNRRRYRVVAWAAMDFLREAVFRSRRILQLRDLLLLALRTLCILLFGLAMARPSLAGLLLALRALWALVLGPDTVPAFLTAVTTVHPDRPVHAVVLVDNSLSTGYQKLDATVLDEAKAKGKEFIEALPRGSRISVIPACGASGGFSLDAYSTRDDALEALAAIQSVDRSCKAHETIDLALEACRRETELSTKKVVLLADQQIARWPTQSLAEHLDQVPGGISVIEVGGEGLENAWVAEVKLRDGVADVQSAARFLATIGYQGPAPRRDVQVTLTIDGQTIAVQTIDLQPGQKREVDFPPYRFDLAVEPGRASYATVEVSIAHDALPADDQRFLVVPVVATLPVVFVDQWGSEEDPKHNRFGATLPLRWLLVPGGSQAVRERQPFRVEHKRIDELDRSVLEDARIVVIAGVGNPETTVPLLREYVEQGGNLILAAGSDFDPAAWNEAAWLGGLGILPAPLDPLPVGRTPEEAPGQLEPFQLDFNSLKDREYFAVESASAEELRDLYALPYFFKTINVDFSDEMKEKLLQTVAEDLRERRRNLEDIDRRVAELGRLESRGQLPAADRQQLEDLEQQRARLAASWLRWSDPAREQDYRRPIEDLVAESKPAVLARYTNGLPFMVERRIGRGRVLLVTSSMYSDWNTLALTNTMLIYSRIMRAMLRDTLPPRNLSTERPLVLPVAAVERSARFGLIDPDGREEVLAVEALGADRYGVTIADQARRGIYRVAASRTAQTPQEGLESKLWEVPLAVNGPAEESELLSAGETELRQRTGQSPSLETAEAITLGHLRAQFWDPALWWWLILIVLAGLLVELVFLAWSATGGERRT